MKAGAPIGRVIAQDRRGTVFSTRETSRRREGLPCSETQSFSFRFLSIVFVRFPMSHWVLLCPLGILFLLGREPVFETTTDTVDFPKDEE